MSDEKEENKSTAGGQGAEPWNKQPKFPVKYSLYFPLWMEVLVKIKGGKGMSITGIAREMNRLPAILYKIVGEMEKRGLVVSEIPEGNKRMKKLCLTDKGKTVARLSRNLLDELGEAKEVPEEVPAQEAVEKAPDVEREDEEPKVDDDVEGG